MKKFMFLACCLLMDASLASEFTHCNDAKEFSELNSSLCTVINAPLSYEDNNNKKVDLFVRKFPSLKDRQGSVWLIAGGPGESGASFYSTIDTFRDAFSHFDVLVADHRGTGLSSSICPGEDVNSAAGKALVGEEWGECFESMYSNLEHVKSFSITNAAKDLRYLINTLSGKGKTFVYGVSYGTQLVLRTAQLDNVKLDGVVLDSLVPMQDDKGFDLSQRSKVVNLVGQALLDKCNNSDMCGGETSDSIKSTLSELLNRSNNLTDFSKNLPNASLTNTLGIMLDIPDIRNRIPDIITGLSNHDPSALEQAVKDVAAYYDKFNPGYSNFGSSIPLVQIITASENNLRPELTKNDVLEEEKTLLFTSPLPALMAENTMPTYKKDTFFAESPNALPRTLILHGKFDPKTHYKAARRHSVALSKVGNVSFVEIKDGVHFIALNAPECFKENVALFMSDKLQPQGVCQDEKTLVTF